MISSALVQLLIRCRSSLPSVRERAIGELDDLDPSALSVEDCTALIAAIPDLVDARPSDSEDRRNDAAHRVLERLHCDLGTVDSTAIERIYPYLTSELAPLVIGILAHQNRPEAWLGLRRVLHLELSQSGHRAPNDRVLEPLATLCDEPTFVLDALIEAIDDPLWTIPAAQCIMAWHQRSLLSERDIERVREKIPVLEALIADSRSGDAANGSTTDADRDAIDRLFPERPLATRP